MRSRLRWLLIPVVGLAGCVNFHPRNPPWLKPAAADAAEATAKAAPVAAAPARTETDFGWRVVGQSVQGRPLRATTIGHGPRKVLWIGGIHGNEREGSVATAELPAAFLSQPGAAKAVTLTILEDSNPDGSAKSTRGNANGVDLNRNFPAENFKPHRMFGIRPLSQPESRAVHDLVLQLQPDLVIVAHSWNNDRFINFDGPAAALAQRFARLSSYPLRASEDIAATPGSLGSWVGIARGTPILTIEYRRGRAPAAAWEDTRHAILSVILGDGVAAVASGTDRSAPVSN